MEILGFSRDFSSPYAAGTSPTALVPGKYDVSIDGRGYMLDRKMLASGQFPLVSSIRATRTQSDSSQEPGEQSLTPDDLWRRTQQSWHLGAGQDYLDRDDSDRRRFRASKGIDCWTENQISLLNATTQVLSAEGTNLQLMPAGSRLYAVDGTALKYTTDMDSWSTVTGTSGATITSIASDGFNVWIADGSNVYKTDAGSASASSWSTEDIDVLGYVKGRLMGSDGPELTYISSMSGPTWSSLFTHGSTSFTWVGFAEGPGYIYAAGYSGDKSLIYKIAITKEGTSLDAPIVAGELPDGEAIASIGSYLGFILLGTSKGARFCTVSSSGDLTIGSIIPTSSPVQCFEGQEEFIWFGWTNYDGTNGGLGRMSLRNFSRIDALKPAYASDLMTASTADILSVCTFDDKRVFAVSGAGYYAEDTANLVTSGTIDCGRMNWGITEKKVPAFIDLTFKSDFDGECATYYAVDGGTTFSAVGTQTTDALDTTSATYEISEDSANEVEIRHVLTRGSTTTKGPVLIRHTLRAQPIPNLRQRIVLPLLLHEVVRTNAKSTEHWDPLMELGYIEGWRSSKRVITSQIGNASYATTVDDFDFLAAQETKKRDFWQGTALVHLKTI